MYTKEVILCESDVVKNIASDYLTKQHFLNVYHDHLLLYAYFDVLFHLTQKVQLPTDLLLDMNLTYELCEFGKEDKAIIEHRT